MRKPAASLLCIWMAFLLLMLQGATSSPALHGWLHGAEAEAHGCSGHEGPCENGPAGSEEPSCKEACAVMMLTGGLALSGSLSLQTPAGIIEAVYVPGPASAGWPGRLRTVEARAPPVL